jgi:bifunctional UDP-N-acetylglucosamine pyrophosphorylase / glucosamine-1-phosphate N-acetyltransferase
MKHPLQAPWWVVLAGGKSRRMLGRNKMLEPILGKPVLETLLEKLKTQAKVIFVVPPRSLPDGALIQKLITSKREDALLCEQTESLGTGHALQCVFKQMELKGSVVVCPGDVPFVKDALLSQLSAPLERNVRVLTERRANPFGLGRILRNADGEMVGIREERDATAEERKIREVAHSLYHFDAAFLETALSSIESNNAQGEYYLTDVLSQTRSIETLETENEPSLSGFNTPLERQLLEAWVLSEWRQTLLSEGVRMLLPESIWIDATCHLEPGVLLEPGVVLKGKCHLAAGVKIGAYARLEHVVCGEGAEIKSHSVLVDTVLGPGCEIGPFAHLRPGTTLQEACKVGNFVELKATSMGPHSKASHLSYLGDCSLGSEVNIGAGFIHCNFDGSQKHKSHIDSKAFIGSQTILIGPRKVGKGAFVAAGTTVTEDIPDDGFAISRCPQKTKARLAPKLKKSLRPKEEPSG